LLTSLALHGKFNTVLELLKHYKYICR